jgi:hypothetical protein
MYAVGASIYLLYRGKGLAFVYNDLIVDDFDVVVLDFRAKVLEGRISVMLAAAGVEREVNRIMLWVGVYRRVAFRKKYERRVAARGKAVGERAQNSKVIERETFHQGLLDKIDIVYDSVRHAVKNS